MLKYEKVGHFRKDYYESLRTGLLYYNEYVHRVLRAEKQSVQLFWLSNTVFFSCKFFVFYETKIMCCENKTNLSLTLC